MSVVRWRTGLGGHEHSAPLVSIIKHSRLCPFDQKVDGVDQLVDAQGVHRLDSGMDQAAFADPVGNGDGWESGLPVFLLDRQAPGVYITYRKPCRECAVESHEGRHAKVQKGSGVVEGSCGDIRQEAGIRSGRICRRRCGG